MIVAAIATGSDLIMKKSWTIVIVKFIAEIAIIIIITTEGDVFYCRIVRH